MHVLCVVCETVRGFVGPMLRVFCFMNTGSLRAKLSKSLTSGIHDDEFSTKLEIAIETGEAAQALSSVCGSRASAKNYALMRSQFEKIEKESAYPTLNVSRQWTMESAQFALAAGNPARFVDILRLWSHEDEADLDSPGFEQWERENALVWKIVPTLDDEESAEEAVGLEPESPAIEVMQWEMERSFDRATKAFGSYFITGWSCEAMYELLKTNIDKTCTVLRMWIDEVAMRPEDCKFGPIVSSALERTITFSRAFLAVAENRPVNKDSYDCFVQVYMPQKKQPEFFKLMATVSRKNADFKTREVSMIRFAAKELEFGPDLLEMTHNSGKDGWLDKDKVDEIAKKLVEVREACRPGATADLEQNLRSWLKAQAAIACECGDSSQCELLTFCDSKLAFFCEAAEASDELHGIRTKVVDTLRRVRAQSSGQELASLSESVQRGDTAGLEAEDFVSKLDALRGHDIAATQPTIEDLGMSLQESIKMRVAAVWEEGGVDKLQIVMKNILAVSEYSENYKVDKSVVKPIVDKACALVKAHKTHTDIQSKPNIHAFNKAALAWKAWKLPVQHQSEFNVALLRGALCGVEAALVSHLSLQTRKVDEASADLKSLISESAKISKGCRDGSSWKEGLAADIPLEDVMKLAHNPRTGLVNGPGGKVMACKEVLDEASLMSSFLQMFI